MASFEQYRAAYEKNWANLVIRTGRRGEVDREAARLMANKARYLEVQKLTGVPWWFVGLCHYRESHFNFNTYLGNGQPLNKRTTIVPIGRGPFKDFTEGAVDALKLEGFTNLSDWSIARVAYRLEGFNGYGYHSHGVPSPYLYGGSTVYVSGKYVRDHVFDPNFVDSQLGTLTILKGLLSLDPSISFGTVTPPSPDIAPTKPKPVKSPAKTAAGGAVVAGGGAVAGAVAGGLDWNLIIAIGALAALLAFGAFLLLRRKS